MTIPLSNFKTSSLLFKFLLCIFNPVFLRILLLQTGTHTRKSLQTCFKYLFINEFNFTASQTNEIIYNYKTLKCLCKMCRVLTKTERILNRLYKTGSQTRPTIFEAVILIRIYD